MPAISFTLLHAAPALDAQNSCAHVEVGLDQMGQRVRSPDGNWRYMTPRFGPVARDGRTWWWAEELTHEAAALRELFGDCLQQVPIVAALAGIYYRSPDGRLMPGQSIPVYKNGQYRPTEARLYTTDSAHLLINRRDLYGLVTISGGAGWLEVVCRLDRCKPDQVARLTGSVRQMAEWLTARPAGGGRLAKATGKFEAGRLQVELELDSRSEGGEPEIVVLPPPLPPR